MIKYLTYITIVIMSFSFKSDKTAYQFFTEQGKKTEYQNLLKQSLGADVIFFGELHNNPIAHWLEIELCKDLYKHKPTELILGAEMFEADNQLILNEYLNGLISTKRFEDEAKIWTNYITDYKPIVEFAKAEKITFIASNVPRRYASMVAEVGFEALENLSSEAKKFIAPLPINYVANLNGYKKMAEMGHMGGNAIDVNNLAKAQALKDATMAYFIIQNLSPGKTILHFNGSYHSENFEGIVWHIKQQFPELKILTIATVSQDSIQKLNKEYLGIANFILAVPSTMTNTR